MPKPAEQSCGNCFYRGSILTSMGPLSEEDDRCQCQFMPPHVTATLVGIEEDPASGAKRPSYHFSFQQPISSRSLGWCGQWAPEEHESVN
jgi:hypothetical protein